MQTALFRLGAIIASPDFLTSVPRPEMVRAIKQHATEDRPIRDGHPVLSWYSYGNTAFHVVTDAERRSTAIRLNDER
jgi:hypothetical protein